MKKLRNPDIVYAMARDIVECRTLSPAYLADDYDWYASVEEAREMLGIVERAPMCVYCGSVAPYGDARHEWISWHNSKLHRWWHQLKYWKSR
jgi:hypothetical protein